jgi:hypothetical protein
MKKTGSNANPDEFPPMGGVLASKMIFDDNIKPQFVYREKRMNPADSGWRIFTGFESDEYLDEADNFDFYNPSTLLAIDSSLWDVLLAGAGSVYEKTEDGTHWNKVTDYELDDDYMVTHPLTDDWVIHINNLFERIPKEDGDLLYTTGDKSVRIAVWEEEKDKDTLYAEYKEDIVHRDQSEAKTLETYDFSDDTIARVGYLIREKDEDKEYSVLYGFSIVDQETIQVALYFDNGTDFDWAIETWKGITRDPAKQQG